MPATGCPYVHPDEWRFTVAAINGKCYTFQVLAFGSASAPTVWGRFAAFVGRSTAAITQNLGVRLQMYVGDPLFITVGARKDSVDGLTVSLQWLSILGLPLAWHKSDGGHDVTWIFAAITVSPEQACVTVPVEKLGDFLRSVDEVMHLAVIPRKALRSLTGKLSFVAALVPQMRPFLVPLWAVAAQASSDDIRVSPADAGPTSGRKRSLP
jgi:hypothetical protein